MDNNSIIFLPAGDPAGYASGHFGRVYDYVIAPACRLAGLWPERIENSNTPASDIIRIIIESDVAICDLSSNNTDVLYAFAIRQALNLPSVLIKDAKTSLNFYSNDFKAVEYDDSLRIDTVQKATEALGQALKDASSNAGEKSTLFNRLGISFAKPVAVVEPTVSFEPIPLVEPSTPKEPALPVISPLPDYVGDSLSELDIEKIKAGDFVFHINYGKGEIKTARKVGKDKMAEVSFDSGSKVLVLNSSGPLRKVI
jgi:hypothetical protein